MLSIPVEAVYPVVVQSQDYEVIARINPDRTWSVKWDAVLDQAYRPMAEQNIAVRAVCQVLAAGRDNFRTSAWDSQQPWSFAQYEIGYNMTVGSEVALALVGPERVMAYVNLNGLWSVDWSEVADIQAMKDNLWRIVPLTGFCELLIGAKDNFHTIPMQFH